MVMKAIFKSKHIIQHANITTKSTLHLFESCETDYDL